VRRRPPPHQISPLGLLVATLATLVAGLVLLIGPADGGVEISAEAPASVGSIPVAHLPTTTGPPVEPPPTGPPSTEPPAVEAEPAIELDPTSTTTAASSAPVSSAPSATASTPPASPARASSPAVVTEPPPPAPTVTAPPTTPAPPAPSTEPEPGGPSTAELAALRQCESGGNYTVVSANGLYHGAYQFSQATWNAVARLAGRSDLVGVLPSRATPSDQDSMAAALWRADGPGHWPGCAGALGMYD
jgi:hypothetical protein